MQRRYLIITAHPDDADIRFGGTAAQLVKAGHVVKFASLCNGNMGHQTMTPDALAKRRYLEAQASKEVSGICENEVWTDVGDCELTPSLENRKRVIRMIRKFQPDVVLTHRLCDYHADHRATGQLVLDAAYLTQVPHYCPETPIPAKNPVYGFVFDAFTDPRPFRPDAAVPVDDWMELKFHQLDCHVSQFYEWLASEKGVTIDSARMTWEEKKAYLDKYWGVRYVDAANQARQTLIETYGEAGRAVKQAESFEYTPYGSKVTVEEFRELFRVEPPAK